MEIFQAIESGEGVGDSWEVGEIDCWVLAKEMNLNLDSVSRVCVPGRVETLKGLERKFAEWAIYLTRAAGECVALK